MPKLDRQKRLVIPILFRKEANLSSVLALCYDFKKNSILICNSNDVANKNVLSFKTLEPNGRIIIPPEVLKILNLRVGDSVIFYLENQNVFFKKT